MDRRRGPKKRPSAHRGILIIVILMVLFSIIFWASEETFKAQATNLHETNVPQNAESAKPPGRLWNFFAIIPVFTLIAGFVSLGSSYLEKAGRAQAVSMAVFNIICIALFVLILVNMIEYYQNYSNPGQACYQGGKNLSLTSECTQFITALQAGIAACSGLILCQFLLTGFNWKRNTQILKAHQSNLPLNKFVADLLRTPPSRNILFLGLEKSGKTHNLYRLKWNEELMGENRQLNITSADLRPYPTHVEDGDTKVPQTGYNNEIIKFHDYEHTRIFEFWDLNGTDRWMWKSFINRIVFDAVVFFIDATGVAEGGEAKKSLDNDEDTNAHIIDARMELHALINDHDLRQAQFFVYYNFKLPDDDLTPENKATAQALTDFLELSAFEINRRQVRTIEQFPSLRNELLAIAEKKDTSRD